MSRTTEFDPEITVARQADVGGAKLTGGRYEQAGQVKGDEVFLATRPFPVEVVPARLVAGLRPR